MLGKFATEHLEHLDHAPAELGHALHRGDPHRRRRRQTRGLEQRDELHRDDAEDEPVERHDEREEGNGDRPDAALERRSIHRLSALGRGSGGPVGGLSPCEAEPVQREAHGQVDHREQNESVPPTDLFVQRVADHPEHR